MPNPTKAQPPRVKKKAPQDLAIVQRHLDSLRGYENNARTHSGEQIEELKKSIQKFGFTNPLLIDEKGMIIAGHGRMAAAKQLGMSMVPCVVLSHLSDAAKRAYILADNKLAANAGWDWNLLSAEMQRLQAEGFDMGVTGFTAEEISAMQGGTQDWDSAFQEDHAYVLNAGKEKDKSIVCPKCKHQFKVK